MPDHNRNRSDVMAYAAAGMEPPPAVPLRKNDPRRVGPYVLMSVLGSGGMGRVYLGRNAEGGPGPAAVKVIRPEYAEDPQFRKRFEREVGALASVQGAHTVRLMGSGSDEDLLWVATEYVPGPTLDEAVAARGPLDAEAAWRLMADMGRAIEAMWRAGIVHRDLKPSNVILAADGARVIDFGVVQAADGTSITSTGQNVGTPAYMSPEQVRGKEVTAASDVFSLASSLTYALVGEAPFGEGTGVDVLHRVAFDPPKEDVLDKVTAVDAELAAFVRVCLDKDPERRPAPDAVFRTAIGHQLSAPAGSPPRSSSRTGYARDKPPAASHRERPPADPRVQPPADPVPSAPRRRRNIMLGAAAVVAALIVGGVTVALQDPAGTPASADPGQPSSPAVAGSRAPAPGTSPAATPTATASKRAGAANKPLDSPDTQDPSTLDIRTAACVAEISSGAQGPCVTALQKLLAGYGLDVTVDGRFGEQTLAAVKAFQTEAGLTANGKVGAETKESLYSGPRGPVRSGALTVTESVNGASVARCLTAGGSDLDIQVSGCKGTATQKWALYRVPGQDSQYLVVNQGNHRCLDADADAGTTGQNGQKIRASGCDGLSAQKWRLGASGPSGGRTLVSVPDGFCLDAEAATSGQDGQKVQGWGCAGSVNQAWSWS